MTILAVNSLNTNKNNNIAFGSAKEKEHNKTAETVSKAATIAGAAALGVIGYKKNWAQKTIKWLSECKPMKNKVFPNYEKDNAKFMSMIGVTSIVLKDGLGCYFYVKQSLNNDKIPEDKRKFVAALDLANGGLMIAMQLLMFFTISNKKVQGKIFNKLFGKTLQELPIKLSRQNSIKLINSKECPVKISILPEKLIKRT